MRINPIKQNFNNKNTQTNLKNRTTSNVNFGNVKPSQPSKLNKLGNYALIALSIPFIALGMLYEILRESLSGKEK